jgi:hypothetical protein
MYFSYRDYDYSKRSDIVSTWVEIFDSQIVSDIQFDANRNTLPLTTTFLEPMVLG